MIAQLLKNVLRAIRNFSGHRLGFGGCPNCGDRWNWKLSTSVMYGTMEITRTVTVGDRSESNRILVPAGVMICNECFEHPEQINLERMAQKLARSGWQPEEVDQAVAAVRAELLA